MNHGQWMLVYLRRGTKPRKDITKSPNFTQLIVPPPYLSKITEMQVFPNSKVTNQN